jgi:hypothetical protein
MAQPGIRLTRAGWLVLVCSVVVGLGLAVGLKVWFPEKFNPTDRHDPRNQATAYPFVFIPLVAGGLAIVSWCLGYPVLRKTDARKEVPQRGEPPDTGD